MTDRASILHFFPFLGRLSQALLGGLSHHRGCRLDSAPAMLIEKERERESSGAAPKTDFPFQAALFDDST